MTHPGDHGPPDEEEFRLSVEVPENVRGDPQLLREWLARMSHNLLHADEIHVTQRPETAGADAGGADSVSVTMLVRPCGGRF
jgi:hypothetical protein